MKTIKFLNEAPENAQLVMMDEELLKKVGCIMVDDVAIVFSKTAVLPPIKCTVGPVKKAGPLLRPLDLLILRRESKASRAEWAKKLGVHMCTILRYETQYRPLRPTTLRKMESALKKPLDYHPFLEPHLIPKSEREEMRKITREIHRMMAGRAWESTNKYDAMFTF